jgi:uncharacterized protein YodC (DUF2158 family)
MAAATTADGRVLPKGGSGFYTPPAPGSPPVGRVVRLKSGGPPMTVQKGDGARVLCGWFDAGQYQTDWFHMDALAADDSDEG